MTAFFLQNIEEISSTASTRSSSIHPKSHNTRYQPIEMKNSVILLHKSTGHTLMKAIPSELAENSDIALQKDSKKW